MLHSTDNAPKPQYSPSTLNSQTPVKTITSPIEQDTIGRTVVIKGKITGNIQCSDRVDIRSEGSLTGDVISQRISVEDGALLRGSVQLTPSEQKHDKSSELPKTMAAVAGKSN